MLQTNLFGEPEMESLLIEQAASEVGVSSATIRNWIKTGYLISTSRGQVTRESLSKFVNEIAGKEKLHTRANKLQKDSHNHDQLTSEISEKAKLNDTGGERLSKSYENSLSESHRNREGIYYTPLYIVNDMLSGLPQNLENKLFLDPCCGGGNFIIQALNLGFKPENVYGFDTDANAIAITKMRIFEKTGYDSINIIHGDFLEKAHNLSVKYDYIFTNPPWGKKITKALKERYGIMYKAGKSLDTSCLFFFAGLSCLSENGNLGFLLPEAFFNISTFREARNAAMNLMIERLIDFEKPFKGLLTKAQAIILKNRKINNTKHFINCESAGKTTVRSLDSFKVNPKSIINFWLDEDCAKVINHVFKRNHITLEGNAEWGLGIVTGNNEKYCKNIESEHHIPVYKGSDITENGLKKSKTFIPDNLSLYQQVAPAHLYEAPGKLIYKFISSKLCFCFDTEKRYILNSANMLILKKNFPVKEQQLAGLFNSSLMNWLFQSIYHTHKILRGDLETLPIHTDYFQSYHFFDESTYLNFLNIEKTVDGTFRIKE
jgi:site-specific DNA-methyltransferase (adenine-specific)